MATKGQFIVNSITGEKITWLETSKDTNGGYLLMGFEVLPGGSVPVRHIHPSQHEHFEVESGTLRLEMDGETKILTPGKSFSVPKGRPHQWWNDSAKTPLKMKVRLEPALNTETFFEQFFGLVNDGKTSADGSPNFLQVMAMSNEYEIYIAGPPLIIQKIMSGVLGGIAQLLGYKKYYKKYDRQKDNLPRKEIFREEIA